MVFITANQNNLHQSKSNYNVRYGVAMIDAMVYGSYAALVAEIADRIRFLKHFVILGNVE